MSEATILLMVEISSIEEQLKALDKDDLVQQAALIERLQSLVAKFIRLKAEAASNNEL